jgi:hypothetical protein
MMLERWQDFYVLVGTAAAALIALLFVAVSIGVGALSRDRQGPTRTYMSPVAFHFAAVLFVAAVALIPSHTRTSLGLLLGSGAVVGMVYAAYVIRRLLTDNISDLPDRLAYGLAPLVAYATIFAAAVLLHGGSERGADVLASAVLLLLIVNVRNAWDLLLAMARRQSQSRGGGAG